MKRKIIFLTILAVLITSGLYSKGNTIYKDGIQEVMYSEQDGNQSQMDSRSMRMALSEAGEIKKEGKLRSGGLIKCYIDGSTAGDCYGYEVHTSPEKRMFLDKVGFYYCDGDSAMTAMKFRINIYDMSNVKGDVTDKFVSVLDSPIYFEFERGAEKSGKFEYQLTDAVELPNDAMVEIEMLENLNESKLWFKSGLRGKQNWSKSSNDSNWILNPFSTPFFLEYIEVKAEF